MDNILDPAWRLYRKPFEDESLILEDWIPLGMLWRSLQILANYCEAQYDCSALYTFEDWHEKNGQLSRRDRTSYADWKAAIATQDSLYHHRPSVGLHRAYYNATEDFLLRYTIIDAESNNAQSHSFPKAWGDLSFSAGSDDIRTIIRLLKPVDNLPLNLIGSAAYFEATWGR